jgi:hypothetical protein
VVYEDGTITATAGVIGGIELGNFNTLQRLEVIMQNGDTFNVKGNQAFPNTLYFTASPEGFAVKEKEKEDDPEPITWERAKSSNGPWISFSNSLNSSIDFSTIYEEDPNLEIYYIKVTITSDAVDDEENPIVFSKIFTINI